MAMDEANGSQGHKGLGIYLCMNNDLKLTIFAKIYWDIGMNMEN